VSALVADIRVPRGDFDVDVRIVATGSLALVGASGSGKSTLLRALAGLEPETRGSVQVGESVWQSEARSIAPALRQVGYLGQRDGLFEHMTAVANVEYALRGVGLKRRARKLEARRLLDGLLQRSHGDRRPGELSGGQRRRVALARALATSRAAYLIDEPFTGLDEATADRTALWLAERLSELGAPALIAGHDVTRLNAVCSRVVTLYRGRVSVEAEPTRVRTMARSPRSTAGMQLDCRGGSR
jgi:ABC-type sulfate/molybdate transport systems ATPase subunit